MSLQEKQQMTGEIRQATDLQTVDLARAGSMQAFCEMYDRYKDQLYRYAVYRLGNREDAEDVVQDCILDAWRQIGKLKSSEAFHSWIFKILAGCCSKKIRGTISQREKIEALKQEPEEGPRTGFTDHLMLEQAFSQLDEQSRDIVLLSVVGGFTSEEVSRMVGLRPGSVRSRLSRSLKKMRECLEDES